MYVIWITLATVGGIALVTALGRLAASMRPQSDLAGLPMTPLERLGWIGVAVTGAITVGLGILVLVSGVSGFHETPAARVIFWALLMIGIAVWWVAWALIRRRSGAIVVDERDRAVLARSFAVESAVVLLSLVAWTVTLTEVFWDEAAIPIGYLQLLFWTTFILGAFGRSLGIVLGYRRDLPEHA